MFQGTAEDGNATNSKPPGLGQGTTVVLANKLDRLLLSLQRGPAQHPVLLPLGRHRQSGVTRGVRSRSAMHWRFEPEVVRPTRSDSALEEVGIQSWCNHDTNDLSVTMATEPAAPVTTMARDPSDAAIKLQQWWRRTLEARVQAFEVLIDEISVIRESAAEDIQRIWRGFVGREFCRATGLCRPVAARRTTPFARTVVPITGSASGPVLLRERRTSNTRASTDPSDAAVMLQQWWRRCMAAREETFEQLVSEMMVLRESAAMEVQTAWRHYLSRKRRAAHAA
mmetsp:Transcript_51371/g.94961  ORF Transcript_51371/g.94961 Transcript_51371/m.94961 type:complete len:282 (-) Transcript_51371:144-989(-)